MDDELNEILGPDPEKDEPNELDILNSAFNTLRENLEDILGMAMGAEVGIREWILVAVPTIKVDEEGEGISIPIEPRIVTERFLRTWQMRGLLIDALKGLDRDDVAESVLMALGGEDDDE